MTSATEELREAARHAFVLVPPIFPVELQNILRTGERKGRLRPPDAEAFWRDLSSMDIRVRQSNRLPREPMLLRLARSHGLTTYDAAYLEAAQSMNLPLATLDYDLRDAARSLGLQVLPILAP